MTTLELRFPAGRYHATPWGLHVNEGAVEWPPGPWRLLRALISVGHATLGWDEGVPETARRLVSALASDVPTYTLPPAGLGHSRHYMPLGRFGKGREDTSLVFDAFARPGDGVLFAMWPVLLGGDERDLLAALAARLGYLGRAESWVEATLVPPGAPPPRGTACDPSAPGSQAPGRGWEQISLLAPVAADEYARWKGEQVAAALARPELQPAPGAKATAALRKRRERAVAGFPEDLWSCLVVTTSELQAAGWSQPPGSRRVLYWRRSDALEMAPAVACHARARPEVEAILLALTIPSGNAHALPPVWRTLPQSELLHRAAVGRLGGGRPVPAGAELVGKDAGGVPLKGHRHAHVLPLDLDRDGHIDHALFWAPARFGDAAQEAIRAVSRTWTKNGTAEIRVAVAATGAVGSLPSIPDPWGGSLRRLIGPATRWRSVTPFVAPRHVKARGAHTLEGQVRSELACRGLPEPARLRAFDRDEALAAGFRHFVLERKRGGAPPPVHGCSGLELLFEEPVLGPLCLGYASHYGLGRFESADE